jgi:hypothetical protein
MQTDVKSQDVDQLGAESKESIEKARDLVAGLKIVQEHENEILRDDKPGQRPVADNGS